jgi:hypothetical protein
MRTLLRHKETGLYLQSPERWTTNPEIAFDFRFVERAQHFAGIWGLENVVIVFALEDSQIVLARGELQEELSLAA